VKGSEHIIFVEGYLEAHLNNISNRKNKGKDVWLGLGDCHIATPQRLKHLTRVIKHNPIKTVTFCLDSDKAGFNSIRELLTDESLKIIRPFLPKLFFFCWDKLASPEIKDIHELHEQRGYFYLDYLDLIKDRAKIRNIYEQLTHSCFKDSYLSEYIDGLNARELEKGILQLLSAIEAFTPKDLMELDVALCDRFKNEAPVLKVVQSRIAKEIEKIEQKNYETSVKDWGKQIHSCTNSQTLDILLASPPKKDILTMPIHENAPTEEEWAKVDELIPTHYWKLDQYVGYTRGGLHIIGGRPGDGKSTIMLNLMRSLLSGNPAANSMFITLEESKEALKRKLLLSYADVILDEHNPLKNYENLLSYLKRGQFVKDGKLVNPKAEIIAKIEEAKQWIGQCITDKRLTILSPSTTDVVSIVKSMREYNKYFGYDFFFLDYFLF
jgi:hypothetical protein